MKLCLNSITHRNCPVEEREKVTFSEQEQEVILKMIHAEPQVSEAAILQTCNRTEFYSYAKKGFDVSGFLTKLIARVKPDSEGIWQKYQRESTGGEVVRHLFEVSAGLDSQMLGENQVLSQVKSAYSKSFDYHMSRLVFHHLFHCAFRVGKAVRTKTNICCGAVSIALAAVELAKKKIDLTESSAMVIGAGENAELAAKYLLKAQLAKLIIANRSREKAKAMKGRLKSGKVIGLKDVVGKLAEVDLLIASTAATEPVITYKAVKDELGKRKKPLLMIDIAVPRDIEDEVTRCKCVRLHNIDDLDKVISVNKRKRSGEVMKAQKIVDEFTAQFAQWYEALSVMPVIARLTQKGISIAHEEAMRYSKDFGNGDGEKLRLFAESLVKKLLHGPIRYIKSGTDRQAGIEQLQAVDLINKMFLCEEEHSR